MRGYVWVTWGRASCNHAARVNPRDVVLGAFPLACGRWAPDGLDVAVFPGYRRRDCRRCLAAVKAAAAHPGDL